MNVSCLLTLSYILFFGNEFIIIMTLSEYVYYDLGVISTKPDEFITIIYAYNILLLLLFADMWVDIYLNYYHIKYYIIYFTDFRCDLYPSPDFAIVYFIHKNNVHLYYYCLYHSGRLTYYYTRVPTTRARTPVTGDDIRFCVVAL